MVKARAGSREGWGAERAGGAGRAGVQGGLGGREDWGCREWGGGHPGWLDYKHQQEEATEAGELWV